MLRPRNDHNPVTDLPDSAPVLQLIEDFRRSKAMFAAVSLGVFDALETSAATASELASRLGVKTEPLERLLDACVGLNLLRRRDTAYENKPVARAYLCRTSPCSLAGYILYSNDVLFQLWSHLEDAIREGTPRWSQSFGTDGSIFDHFFRTPEAKGTFLHGMHGLGVLSSPGVVAAFSLANFRQMVDLGGGTGHLAISACEKYPALRASIFDLPQVVETAKKHVAQSSAGDRLTTMGGDFFRDELPEADLFGMGRILHDWPEEKIRTLLAKIYRKLPTGGGILLAEKLLQDDKTGPISAQLQSLNMLACTEGKERSLSEYRLLLEDAGFVNVQGRITGCPLDAVIGFKP